MSVRRSRLYGLSEAQNHRCCYCGIRTTYQKDRSDSATVEHVLPRGIGGTDTWANLVMACLRCNNFRKTFDPYQFYELRLWEHPTTFKLLQMGQAFKRNPNVPLLKIMARYCGICG